MRKHTFSFAPAKKILLSTTALLAAGVTLAPGLARAVDDFADWDSVTITNGSAGVADTGLGTTTIDQHSMRAVGEAQELHIGSKGAVTINQGSKDALFVGRVVGDHDDPTQILGTLSADGRVMILDRNGVLFGQNSRVDAAGIAVSTGDVSDEAIMSGSESMTFENFGEGKIELNGTINVTDAGLAAFVSPTVKNNGVISAKLGKVVMASGEKVTLDLYGDGLVSVAVEGELGDALIENKGQIYAEGGEILLTAAAAKGVVDTVINNEGLVSASSASVKGGKIILSAGEGGVAVSGTVDASGVQGGDIEITGAKVDFSETGAIKNAGEAGDTYVYGREKATFKGTLSAGENSTNEISARELELGGEIELGESSTISFDPVTFTVNAAEAATFVSALNNNGVTVNVEAEDQIIVNADIDSSAQTKTSTLYFKDENADSNLQVDLNAKIKLGSNQTLGGEATAVNVASTGLIQNGVNVSASGAVVNVAAGTYNESVKVDRALTLNGANAGLAGDDAARGAESILSPNSPGFLVTTDDVTIDGFEIIGGNAGVHVKNSDRATIKNNNIHGQFHPSAEGNSSGGLATGDGVFVENSDGTIITANLIEDYNDDGVHVRGVKDITVTDNVINDNGNGDEGIGISLATGTTTVIGNTVTNARRDGIQLIDVNGISDVSGNTVTGSTASGISLVNVKGGTTVDNNTIIGGAQGIDVNGSNDVLIGDDDAVANSGNTITGAGQGVRIKNATRVSVQDNTIDVMKNGVLFVGIDGNKRLFVFDNEITAGENGVLVQDGITNGSILNVGAEGKGNIINATLDGVRVDGVISNSRLRVTDSSIYGGDDGVDIKKIGDDAVVAVWYNDEIIGYGGSGVEVRGIYATAPGGGLSIVGNGLIEGFTHDGVTIGNTNMANIGIVDNDLIKGQRHGLNFIGKVHNTNVLIGDDGIDPTPTTIESVVGDGIHFEESIENSNITVGAGSISTTTIGATTSYDVTAKEGVSIKSGNDGIGFEDNISNSTIVYTGNTINSGDNGAEFLGALTDTDVTISGNTIDAGNDGIDFDNSITGGKIVVGTALGYLGNIISSVQSGVEFGKLGISLISDVVIDILDNTINADVHGVAVEGNVSNTAVTISGNDIEGARRGVSVAGGELSNNSIFDIVDNSRIVGGKQDGILIQDVVYGGATANISGNGDVSGGDDGMDLRGLESVTIADNYVHDSGADGINLLKIGKADITGNTIAYNILYGLHADGTENGALTLAGNVFLDNPTGARFESGIVDFSDVSNPNSFIVTPGFVPGDAPVVGMQFDGAPTILTIAGETLGATFFEGYGARPIGQAYYVRFEDGSILDTVANLPILIDGTFASWDGIVPDAFGGVLPPATLQAIEDRLYDADDVVVNGRGQIFVGIPSRTPDDTQDPFNLDNVQDFLREFETPEEQANRASVRVLGLPPIGLLNAQFSLNDIAPNAGEEGNTPESLAAISPQAGGEGQAQAAIQPAAGANEPQVTCWGDALNSLNAGAVTYNFGGTFEDSIAAQSECSTAQQPL